MRVRSAAYVIRGASLITRFFVTHEQVANVCLFRALVDVVQVSLGRDPSGSQ